MRALGNDGTAYKHTYTVCTDVLLALRYHAGGRGPADSACFTEERFIPIAIAYARLCNTNPCLLGSVAPQRE